MWNSNKRELCRDNRNKIFKTVQTQQEGQKGFTASSKVEIHEPHFEEPKENSVNFDPLRNLTMCGANSVTTSNTFNSLLPDDENNLFMLNSLKVDSEEHCIEQTVLGDSKTSTSSALTEDMDEGSKVILDEDVPLQKDFINKKRRRRCRGRKNCK